MSAPDRCDLAAAAPPERRRAAQGRMTAAADALWRGWDVLLGRHASWGAGARGIAVGWVLSRALMVLLLVGLESTILNDVRYYAAGIAEVGPATPPGAVLREYPTPVLGLLAVPWLLGRSIGAYVVLFVVLMLACDAVFTWLLARHRPRRAARDATTLWLVAGPALGPLALTRFDVLPGMLAGVAVLCLATRPRTAGALVTVGAAIKLWPALLLPAVLGPRAGRLRVLSGAVVTGVVVLAGSLAVGGVDRLLSPLEYQTDRGLQVESVAALPLMLIWSVAHGAWQITFSRFITSEISGPGDQVMLTLATASSLLALALMVLLWLRAWRTRTVSPAVVGWVMLTCTALFIVTNKVFSPQYLLWLSPLAVAVVALGPRRDRGARRFAVVLVVVGALTQVIYPNAYVLVTEMSWANPIGVGLLAARDVGLLGLTWYAAARAWNGTARPATGRRPSTRVADPRG